jgi:hypothetical protein
MSRESALRAYRDSVFHAAELRMEKRLGGRSVPVVGGFIPGVELIGNTLARPLKVMTAFLIGYTGENPEFPKMPQIPQVFKNTDLEQSFKDSWKLQEESAKAKVEGLGDLMHLNISGWWQERSVASHAQAKDNNIMFPEDQVSNGSGASSVIGNAVRAVVESRSSGGQIR